MTAYHLSPSAWVLAVVAALLVGVAKTGVAGLGVLSVALFANVLPTRESTGVVLPLLICADLFAVRLYRKDAHWNLVLRLLPWAAAGVVLGYLAAGLLTDRQTTRLIGLIIVGLCVFQFIRSWRPANETPRPHSPLFAPSMGTLAGFTTMMANAAGPVMNIYLLAMRMPKLQFVGTAAWYFFILNSFKVPFSYKLGLINSRSLLFDAILAPAAIAGAFLGKALIVRMDQKLFERLALGLSFVAGLRLLFS